VYNSAWSGTVTVPGNGTGASVLSNIKLKPPEFKKPGEYFVKTNLSI